jgi:hypothetical protein
VYYAYKNAEMRTNLSELCYLTSIKVFLITAIDHLRGINLGQCLVFALGLNRPNLLDSVIFVNISYKPKLLRDL